MDDGMGGANHVPVRVCAKLGDEGTYPHQAQIPVACRCMHHLRTSCICKCHLDQTLRIVNKSDELRITQERNSEKKIRGGPSCHLKLSALN